MLSLPPQEVAQGRVWSGRRAVERGLVDHLGGLNRAVQLAKQAAGLAADEAVRLLEVSRAQTSPLALVGGGASAGPAGLGMLLAAALAGGSPAAGAAALQAGAGAPLLAQVVAAGLGLAGAGEASAASAAMAVESLASGRPLAAMPDVSIEGSASQALLKSSQAGFGGLSSGGGLFDDC